MAIEKLDITRFLELSAQYPVLDVRSPAEFNHAHIPGAISFPLFTDEQRKVVGTTYKQVSRENAIKVGLEFFGPRMKGMIDTAEEILKSDPQSGSQNPGSLLVHCWRGGMRSAAIAWLLDLYGFRVFTLAGGYKAFRRYVIDTFRIPFSFRILGGYTGSGKTELLKALQRSGEPIIDLEELACHKGSAFGNIDRKKQPGQEMFENMLAMELRKNLKQDLPVWLEDESQRIGLVNIPNELWATMRSSPIQFVKIPFEERLKHIVAEYGELDREKLVEAIGRISEKLGGLNTKMSISLLKQGETLESFRILLDYYDRVYFRALHNRKDLNSLLHTIECKSVTSENANSLIRHTRAQPQKA